MKLHRFISNFDLECTLLEIKEPAIVHQIKKVLRMKETSQAIFSNGRGEESLGIIRKITSDRISVELKHLNTQKSINNVTLYCAILKKENFEWVAQKATEIGISELVPIRTDRVVKQNINKDRVKNIMREAAEQSGRTTIPELLSSMSLAEAFRKSQSSDERWFFDQEGKPLGKKSTKPKSISLFVGPEGGWSPREIKDAKENNVRVVSLSRLTLRGETAAIIASYLGVNALKV